MSSGSAGQLNPVDLAIDRHPAGGLVPDLDAGLLAERHVPEAVQRPAVGGDLDRRRADVGAHAVAGRKEIADGCFDGRHLRPIPEDAQHQRPRPPALLAGHGEPDVPDFARPIEFRDGQPLARGHVIRVGVRLRIKQPAGKALRRAGLHARDRVKDIGGGNSTDHTHHSKDAPSKPGTFCEADKEHSACAVAAHSAWQRSPSWGTV